MKKRTDIATMPDFYDRYIMLTDDVDILEALEKHTFRKIFEADRLKALGDKVYAPDKWTARDILQHALDTERIMAYRALRFARHDSTPLAGFEENDYGKISGANARTLESLFEESDVLRASTLALFKSFTDEMLLREGTASGKKISVLALGFVIAGHAIHHGKVIKERYYPLL